MPFSVEYVPYKSCYFACRSKTLTSCSVTHDKNKTMLMWEFIKKKKPNSMWSTINKNSSCKSRMCSKILDFAAFWNQENTKLSNCKLTFSFSPWQVSWGDADTNKRRSARCAPSYQRAQTKGQEKKRCVSANAHNSLLSYSQSTRFPHRNPLRGKRERPCGRRFAGFQARSSRNPFPVQWEN